MSLLTADVILDLLIVLLLVALLFASWCLWKCLRAIRNSMRDEEQAVDIIERTARRLPRKRN